MGEIKDGRKVHSTLNSHMENGRSSCSGETFIGCLLCSKPWESKSEQNSQIVDFPCPWEEEETTVLGALGAGESFNPARRMTWVCAVRCFLF